MRRAASPLASFFFFLRIPSTPQPLAMGLIKKSIQKAIEEGIRGALVQIDAQVSCFAFLAASVEQQELTL